LNAIVRAKGGASLPSWSFDISVKCADKDQTQDQQLFAESWLNLLESKVPMSIGPHPFSVLSLLESIRAVLAAGARPNTVSIQVGIAAALIDARAWLKSLYPNVAALLSALTALSTKATPRRGQDLTAAIDQLFEFVADRRISSHVDFILSLGKGQALVAVEEVEDLIADLISIGHSQSFLFGWGRGVLLPGASTEAPIADRVKKFQLLGKSRKFLISFRVRRVGILPRTDILSLGKAVRTKFKTPDTAYAPGETSALVKIEAPDYKTAIEKATNYFRTYRDSLWYEKRLYRLDLTSSDFLVRCEDDDTEMSVPPDKVRAPTG
jgi:hypothetical protein